MSLFDESLSLRDGTMSLFDESLSLRDKTTSLFDESMSLGCWNDKRPGWNDEPRLMDRRVASIDYDPHQLTELCNQRRSGA